MLQGSLPHRRYLLTPLTANKEGSKSTMVLRVKPTPTPMDNAPLHSIPSMSPVGLQWCICSVIHPGRVDPVSPRHGDVSWVGSTPRSPVLASLHSEALQLKPRLLARFESAGVSALHTPSHPGDGDARDRILIGRGVLITLSLI